MVIAGIDLDRLPKGRALVASYGLIVVIAVVDYVTGVELSEDLFYLFPVFLALWVAGPWAGGAAAVLATGLAILADVAAGHVYSHVLIIYWNAAIRFGFLAVSLLLLAGLKRSLDAEGQMARHDFLTGALNSRALYESTELERLRALRYGRPLTLVYLDLDDFKLVNDRWGHHVGDEVLRNVAQTLRSVLRANDLVARMGGDEFVLVLPESDPRQTATALRRVRARLAAAMAAGGWPITFSLGGATFLRPFDDVDTLLKLADRLMYTSKRAGKDRIKTRTFRGRALFLPPRPRRRRRYSP